jgi:PHD/YefM family antitoxin component YafN of YafNO toxin-antitoxin module
VAREVVVTIEEWARMKEMRDEAEASGTVFQKHYDNSDADSEAVRFHDEDEDAAETARR